MSRIRKALILAAALVPLPAAAATQYIYRQITPSGIPAQQGAGSAQPQAPAAPAVAAPVAVDVYTGGSLAVPAPTVSNAGGGLRWALILANTDISSGFGNFCPGMAFDAATGAIAGTPTGSCNLTLSYRITVPGGPGKDATTTFSKPFPFTVTMPTTGVQPGSTSIRAGAALDMTASTSVRNPTWSVSGNPPWMTFTADGGHFSTTSVAPQVAQVTTYPITFTATSGAVSASATAYVTVEPITATLPGQLNVRGGAAFSLPLNDPGFELGGWTVTSSPADIAGLAIAGGNLVGTAAANAGTTNVRHLISASRPGNDPSYSNLYVYPRLSVNVISSTVSGTVNQPYQNFLAFTPVNLMGTAGYASSSKLPAGLALDPKTGLFVGTPTEFGSWPVAITLTDSADKATATFNLTLNITNPQNIQFYQHSTSSTYLIDVGDTKIGSNQFPMTVVIRNVAGKSVSLVSASAAGDASDPGAFSFLYGTQNVNGKYAMYSTPQTITFSGSSSYGSATPNTAPPCQATLSDGYYCTLYLRFGASGPGARSGSLSVSTQNGTSTIPLKGTASGFIQAGHQVFATPGGFGFNLGAARQITFRYFVISAGSAGQTNGSYGGKAGAVAYGDFATDSGGNMSAYVGAGGTGTTAQTAANPSNITALNANGTASYGVYAVPANGSAAGGGGPIGTGANMYDARDGGTAANGFGSVAGGTAPAYATLSGVVDPRYGYDSSKAVTAGYAQAQMVFAPGGKGHTGVTGCGASGGVYGGGGGGGGVNLLIGGQPVPVTAPATDGAPYVHKVQGTAGQGFGAGGGGSETESGSCAVDNPRFGTGGSGAGGLVYIEWDAQ